MPLKHLRRKRNGYNTCSFFCTTFVPLHNWPVALEMRTNTQTHTQRHGQCALHAFFCRNWNLSLKFTDIHPKSSFKIIRSSSREIFGSHGADEVFCAVTRRRVTGRQSWRLQDCPALKIKTLWSVQASASNRQGGTSRTTWITGWQGRRIWMLMKLSFLQRSLEIATIIRPKFRKLLENFHTSHVLRASETDTVTTRLK